MRERLLDQLAPTARHRFLVYLMGPYEAFELDDLVDETVAVEDLQVSFGEWSAGDTDYSERDVFALLSTVRDRLRDDAGLNAFLAVDVDVPLDEMDAATQTIQFAHASNVIALVAPAVGKNLGVGIETGAVLEALDDADQERVVFVHEDGVRSAMIASLARRWDVAVYSYADVDELVKRLREFAVDVMTRESTGELPPREE